ncbi:toll/interleukin-1 receptor domain-containing protein [Pararhodospirillum photometricum]|uniref:toll/interleukin-1 receptor domain-containing protein n=1 Tax=Pararhodospirillum photometricum TaxID=1084 RepID=UPI0012FF2B53|nr:toll/interleukin-1 receptor domain-containing protein [Pararhodospirillum photometricum]
MSDQNKPPFRIREDYVYHAFISYKRGDLLHGWLRTHFYKELKSRLTDVMGEEAKIFVDYDVEVGLVPSNALLECLYHSRCLVSICGDAYFRSPWCSVEWRTFEARDLSNGDINLSKDGKNYTLKRIFPIRWQDCIANPLVSGPNGRVCYDFREYRHSHESWSKHETYIDFQKDVDCLAERISALVDGIEPLSAVGSWVNPLYCPLLNTTPEEFPFKL